MTSPADDEEWQYESHMESKHDILAYYLPLWCKIHGASKRNLVYWDGFAGRGDYAEGERGSPLIAMEVSHQCATKRVRKDKSINLHCIFVEREKENYLYLRDLLTDLYPKDDGNNWRVYHDEFADVYASLMESGDDMFSKQYPNFFFLDPYGIKGLPMKLIRQIMARPMHEVLVNLMAETIKRHRNHPDMEPHLKALFEVDDLSRLREIASEPHSEPQIAEYYIERLKDPDGANIKYVVAPFSITPDWRNVVKYLLIFATNHFKGLEVMHDTMDAVSNNEGFSYAGKTDGQGTLRSVLGDDVDEVENWILESFDGWMSTYNLIWQSCCEQLTCSRSLFRKAMLKLEREGHIIVKPHPDKTRRGNSFSDHRIYFPNRMDEENRREYLR